MPDVSEMSTATVAEASPLDNPEAYIPSDRRRALAGGRVMPDRVAGAALFADISGFTPLTEALARDFGPQRGAEELTANLNRVFHAIIEQLDRYGGDVIYFSGDAITCWLDGDNGARATACGLAMQEAMTRVGEVVSLKGSTVRLAMKVAIAVGEARRFLVGEPSIQLIDVLAGGLIDELAAAEQRAERGDVVLEQSALESLGGDVEITELRVDQESGRRFGVVGQLAVPPTEARAPHPAGPLDEEIVAAWLLPAVYERMRGGRGEFLAELRTALPVFVRFGGIDYDHDPAAIDKLDDFVCRAQWVFDTYGGNLLGLTLGDKGAYLHGVFGAPLAHEDDAARAATAALEVRDLEGATAVTDIQIGITQGRLYSGSYGHEQRRTFTCLGDNVNLAARLMAEAPPGQIYVSDQARRSAGDAFAWEQLPEISVKGKAEPIAAHALRESTRQSAQRHIRHRLPMFGRRAELDHLDARMEEAVAGGGAVVGISAEAGLGKSRLVAEFVRSVRRRGHLVAFGECQAFGRNTSYFAWREVWRTLFDLREDDPAAAQLTELETKLAAIDAELAARLPLLGPVVDLAIPENELTHAFDAKLRKTSLEGLLAECLRARAVEEPLVLVLEDCHWLDELSRDLLITLARAVADLPVVVVLAYRPPPGVGGELGVETLPHFSSIQLARLDDREAALLIAAKLQQILGSGTEPPAPLVELVLRRSQANPLYIEELLNYISSQSIDPADVAALGRLELPESLSSLILSRIDQLPEDPRRTLKVASVLGWTFRAPLLPHVYPELGDLPAVEEQLDHLSRADLVVPDVEADRSWLFKHVITQEVAYESLPFAIRESLHESTARAIETTDPATVEQHLDLLAHHYWHSANLDKKREYLERAGEAAGGRYANSSAIDYFERLSTLETGASRAAALLRLGGVLELTGDWARAEEVATEAVTLARGAADALNEARAETALAEVARKTGRFDEAGERLERAGAIFSTAADEAGQGRVLHLQGTLAAQRGDYDEARTRYLESLEIRERVDDRASLAGLLSNLGVVEEYEGNYEASRGYHQRALELRTELDDRWAIGVSQTNLGMIASLQGRYEEARRRFDEAIRLNREVGDPWMVAICHNNLGNATRGLGDYPAARSHYGEALRTYRDYDDRWALAFLIEDVGVLAARTGVPERALTLLGAADALREEIGAPRPPALDAELAQALAASCDALGERAESLREKGREVGLDEATATALAFLGT
jgi:class 3 adenylate cyclase/tetratricopeptide (TPR) repeat protein